jgi:hypothetical protein
VSSGVYGVFRNSVVPWSEVGVGDSVLYQDGMVTVVSPGPEPPDSRVAQWHVRLGNGTEVLAAVFNDSLTVVRRRYDTGEG